jgi:hypothetical protein
MFICGLKWVCRILLGWLAFECPAPVCGRRLTAHGHGLLESSLDECAGNLERTFGFGYGFMGFSA